LDRSCAGINRNRLAGFPQILDVELDGLAYVGKSLLVRVLKCGIPLERGMMHGRLLYHRAECPLPQRREKYTISSLL
jgi:hypothetical protein